MCARSASLAALLCLLLSGPAYAKKTNFDTGTPLGLGFLAGIAQVPESDLVASPNSTSASFGHFVAFEPFLDFGNFVIRFVGQLNYTPVVSSNSNPQGLYTDTSDVSTFLYGLHVLLCPYISESREARGCIRLGYSEAKAKGENVRTYQSGLGFSENFEGSSRELRFGVGYEFMLVQNYSLQLEGGMRQMEFDRFEYTGGTDLSGIPKNKGDVLLTNQGVNRKLNQNGLYASLGLNLNF